MPQPRRTITGQLQGQESDTLHGRNREPFSQVRQRHIWSTYFFGDWTGGAVVNGQLQAGEYQLFQVAQSQYGAGLPAGFVLTDLETNYPGQGRISDDQNFSIWEIGASILPVPQDLIGAARNPISGGPMNPLDLDQIAHNGVLYVRYLTNEVPIGHLADFLQPGGPNIDADTNLDVSGLANVNAGPPIVIEGGHSQGSRVGYPYNERQARSSMNSGNLAASPALRRKLDVPIFLSSAQTFSMKINFWRNVQLLTANQGGTNAFRVRIDWWAVESFREQA